MEPNELTLPSAINKTYWDCILRVRVLAVINENKERPYGYIARQIAWKREYGNLGLVDAQTFVVALCYNEAADVPEATDFKNMMRGMIDSDPMPWGTHRGTPIGEVPFDYLLKYYRKMWLSGEVLTYFENQLRSLEANERETAPLSGKSPKKYLIEDYIPSYPH